MKRTEIEAHIRTYYDEKLAAFGSTAQGVDWNGEASQFLRFEQLCKLFEGEEAVNLLDFGCGYGALLDFLQQKGKQSIQYVGYDLSEKMVQAAQQKWGNQGIFTAHFPEEVMEYVVASGIFNVKQATSQAAWEVYIKETLQTMHQLSSKGFAFNILTAYSDPPFQKDYLYYAKPEYWFAYCKQHFSPYVALLHDYPLYEFCIIVKKG